MLYPGGQAEPRLVLPRKEAYVRAGGAADAPASATPCAQLMIEVSQRCMKNELLIQQSHFMINAGLFLCHENYDIPLDMNCCFQTWLDLSFPSKTLPVHESHP